MTTVKIIVDCGNSETRYWSSTVRKDGEEVTTHGRLSNLYSLFTQKSRIPEILKGDYSGATSSILEFDKKESLPFLNGIFFNGEVALRNAQSTAKQPKPSVDKCRDETVYMAIMNAIDKTINWLTEINKNGYTKEQVIEKLRIDLSILVPPRQKLKSEEVFNKFLVEKGFAYTDLFTGVKVRPSISKVTIHSEGMVGFMGTVLDSTKFKDNVPTSLRSGYEELMQKNVLVLDIGSGTTDVLGVSQGKLMEMTQATIPIGGRNVTDFVQREYEQKTGRAYAKVLFEEVSSKGYVELGDKRVNLEDEVERGYDIVSSMLYDKIVEHLSNSAIDMQFFNLLLVVGGGAVPLTKENGTRVSSISERLLDSLSFQFPDIRLVDTANVSDKMFEGTDFAEEPLRYLNLQGSILVNKMER